MSINGKNNVIKIFVFILFAVFVFLLSNADCNTIYAAGKNAGVVSVNKVKKGTKINYGDYSYRITFLTSKKKTVMINGFKNKKIKKKATSVVIPDTIKIKIRTGKYKGKRTFKVTKIYKKAFYGCNINKAVIGKNVETIDEMAFACCKNLKTVTIKKNSNLKVLASKAFYRCKKMKSINLSNANKLKSVDKTAFDDTLVNYDDQKDDESNDKEKEDDDTLTKFTVNGIACAIDDTCLDNVNFKYDTSEALFNFPEGVINHFQEYVLFSDKPLLATKIIPEYNTVNGYRDVSMGANLESRERKSVTYLPDYATHEVCVKFERFNLDGTTPGEGFDSPIYRRFNTQYQQWFKDKYTKMGYNYYYIIDVTSFCNEKFDLKLYYGEDFLTKLTVNGINDQADGVKYTSIYSTDMYEAICISNVICEVSDAYERKYGKDASELTCGEMMELVWLKIYSYPYNMITCLGCRYIIETAKYYGRYGEMLYCNSATEYMRNYQPNVTGRPDRCGINPNTYWHTVATIIYRSGSYDLIEAYGNLGNKESYKDDFADYLPDDITQITQSKCGPEGVEGSAWNVDRELDTIHEEYKNLAGFYLQNYGVDVKKFDPLVPTTWY